MVESGIGVSVTLSLVAAVVGGVLSVRLARHYRSRRRGHALAWSGSLALFATASAAVAVGLAGGWSPAVFVVYWIAGALVTVPLLAVGQLLFMDPARARVYWGLAGLAGLLAVVAVATSPMDAEALAEAGARGRIPTGEAVFGDSLAMALLPPFNYAAVIVVGGVIWSAARTRRWGLLLIALGVIVAGASFGFVRAGLPAGFSATLASGAVLLYAGFRTAGRPPRATGSSRSARGRRESAEEARESAEEAREGVDEARESVDEARENVDPAGPAADRPADQAGNPGQGGPPARRPRITVYTRQGCGLCREAEQVVAEVAGDDARVEYLDVDADPTLFERYTVRVPVVAVDGEEIFELQVDREALSRALAGAARG